MKYKLNKKQLERIVINVINENNRIENLNEGVKEWMLGGLLTLSSLAGLTQSRPIRGELTSNDIRKAELVQQQLEDGDSTIINLLGDINIQKNKENVEKLKSVDVGSEVNKIKTGDIRRVKSYVKSGYGVTDLILKKDTIINKKDKLGINSIIEFKFDSDVVFGTAKYKMDETYLNGLMDTLNVLSEKGEIKKVLIVSSTDKEPIRMGNEKLAELRSNGVEKFFDSIGVEKIEVRNLPNQGPDIYDKGMSTKSRIEARKKTQKYRYVKVLIEFQDHVESEETQPLIEIVEKYSFELTRVLDDNRLPPKHYTPKRKRSIIKTHERENKKNVCPPTECFEF